VAFRDGFGCEKIIVRHVKLLLMVDALPYQKSLANALADG